MEKTFNSGEINLIRPEQAGRAIETLALAFATYPLVEQLFPDARERQRVLPYWAGYPLRYCLRYGLAYATPGLAGVAVWVNPENARMTYARHIRSGMLTLPFKTGLRTYARMLAIEAFMEKRWEKIGPAQRWYLWIMGVRPDAQGQGLGSALVEVGTRQADAGGFACCLETHNQQNVVFYRKFGFEPVYAGPLSSGETQVYMLVRPAHPRG